MPFTFAVTASTRTATRSWSRKGFPGRHRRWLAAVLFGLAQAAISLGIYLVHPDPVSQTVLSLGLAAIIGYLAADIRQHKLARQGFAFAGVVVGNDVDQAYRRFLDSEPALAADLKP